MRAEDSFQPGETALYHEMGEIDRVEVLSNASDEKTIRYKLKVIKVLQESRVTNPAEVGEEFDYEKARAGGSQWGSGHLCEI